ncbi:sigma-70 family RNA polymerase sigma factor [Bacilli bacterium]|uniref:RNA polymerase sigma factor n=1 Tax=Oceanobacillus caeni TaxID=405946 RepID=UPI0006221709|nr:ECF subfamily RNA polymerase sigma-24 factor [Bacilli bacterium VT-13-104]MBU8789899.1 sigma-70 family RNA polymerase sigma factor [Oceanobacillus caeni]PZD87325.1 sigma-70 family RNA polymerase sigma factor [Bacilli bacterium]PZD88799.1 sigma-70 family RNA polymerase sigma factor [Bacilli bacterium]PZD91653.1 sigma-70 family RNA polymerase sigma factor [Bacilli bacterium]
MDKDNIYQDYADFIFRYLLTLTNDEHAAEELTQETFYQAIKSIDNFHDNGKAKFSTWLCAIAKNVWLQEVNRTKKKHQLVNSLSDESTLFYNLEEEYFRNEDKINFFKKAHQLSETKREILYLRLLGDLSFKEIGSIFGETENWARVTFYRAKQQIRKGDTSYEP